ncbi:MAG: GerMN domain-containing protein [Actinomycetota bacterium]|nr:GerMN domain-containing protein [Actinomycetota bacterium]
MRTLRRAVVPLAALGAAGLLLAACGIPTQPSATPVSAHQIHPRRTVSEPTSSPCTKSGCTRAAVFFLAPDGRLQPVVRVVPSPPKTATVVGALLAGPTTSERAHGFSSALGSRIRLLSSDQTAKKRTVTLNFNADFGTLEGERWILGVAQVVSTVTSIMPGVGVIFEIAGAQTEVPLETGALWTGPVHEAQYASLLTTTTPTTTP